MWKILVGLLGSFVLSAAFAGVAFAATPASQKVPMALDVAKLRPFSEEATYMSLAGYFRYLLHLATGQWISYGDAAQKVQSLVMSGPGS
jgi:hypothetical protein